MLGTPGFTLTLNITAEDFQKENRAKINRSSRLFVSLKCLIFFIGLHSYSSIKKKRVSRNWPIQLFHIRNKNKLIRGEGMELAFQTFNWTFINADCKFMLNVIKNLSHTFVQSRFQAYWIQHILLYISHHSNSCV